MWRGQNTPDAANLWSDWVSNTGKPVQINPYDIMEGVPSFGKAVASLANSAGKARNYDSGWNNFSVGLDESANWFGALGSFSYRVTGRRFAGGSTVNHVQVLDFYNWDRGGKNSNVKFMHDRFTVEQPGLAELNTAGEARDFMVSGTYTWSTL